MNTQRRRVATRALQAALLALLFVPGTDGIMAQSIPATVEDVVRESDLIVLGKVVSTEPEGVEVEGSYKTVFTRHTFRVESYYKGAGPKEISLLTPGGFQTKKIDGKERRLWLQVPGAVSAKEGEEFLAFLQAAPGGYVFVEWDGAKYLVERDPEKGDRTVTLRLRKKKYMNGSALKDFERLVELEQGSNKTEKLEAKLKGTEALHEAVPIKDLSAVLGNIIRGESEQRS